jgi:diguanylate cyclase (GGDEF)-like protein/PAS domain S-box-containing protein
MPQSEKSTPESGQNIFQLRATRDAALLAAQSAIRDTTRLTRLLTILSDPVPLEQLLDRVLSTLSELFSADIVVLLDPAGSGSFSPLAAIGLPEDIMHKPFSNAEGSYTAATMTSQSPILLDEMDKDANIDSQLHDLGVRTGVWLPVIGSYATRGVLIMARCKPIPFIRHDVGLLSAMIYRVGLSLEQTQKSTQLRQVAHFGREIGRKLDEVDVCSKAVSMFPPVIGANSAVLFMKDASGKPECVAEINFDPAWASDWVLLTDYLISNTDFNNIKFYNTPELYQAIEKIGIKPPQDCSTCSLVAVPIVCEEQVQGMLYGIRFSATTFNPDTLQVAMLYASQTSAAVENARLYRSVRNELLERKQVEQALRASDDRFRALIRSVTDVIAILTVEGRMSYISPAAEVAWGSPARKLLSKNISERIHPDDKEMVEKLLSTLQEQPNTTLSQTVRLRYGDDDWRVFDVILTNLLNEPAIGGIVATCHDITERKLHEQELRELAFRDSLTGLSNRSHFRDLLSEALIRATAQGQSVAVIFLDLDNFKSVNDRLGHAWGDHLLRIVADRLQACLRKADSAGRLGGDEFAILVDGVDGIDQVLPVAHRLINSLKAPIRLKGYDLFVDGSFGIAISTPNQNQDTGDELLHRADVAMYAAKSQGKGRYTIFDPTLNETSIGRLEDPAE